MPVNGLILPRPSAAIFGRCRPRRRAMLPKVSAPGGSPKDAASGMAPMPTLSRTIQMMRRNTTFERNTQAEAGHLVASEALESRRPLCRHAERALECQPGAGHRPLIEEPAD